jgi:hypothetical protein
MTPAWQKLAFQNETLSFPESLVKAALFNNQLPEPVGRSTKLLSVSPVGADVMSMQHFGVG